MNLSLNSSLPIPTCGDYSPVYLSSRTAAYTINVVLGLPINCYIMRRIMTGAVEMTPSEFFTANLVVSELLACLGCVFNILFSITNSLWMIDLCIFFDSFLYFSRPLFLTLMSVERYLAVLQPVVFLRWKPLRYRLTSCSVVWLLDCLFSISYLLGIATDFVYYGIATFNILIILAMLFCCVSVLRALTWSGPGGRQRQKVSGVKNKKKRKAFNVTLINTSVPLSYTIYTVMTPFYSAFKYKECFIFLSIISSLNVLVGFIHPLHYLKRLRKLPCMKNRMR